jgi:hypothetical protein
MSSAAHDRGNFQPASPTPEMLRPPAPETLFETTLRVERKNLTLSLRENPRGRFLRITEEVNGRRDAVVVPASGLEQFAEALGQVLVANRANPAEDIPPPP